MRSQKSFIFAFTAGVSLIVPFGSAEIVSAITVPSKVLESPSGAGRFDWMMIDEQRRRLLASHKDAGSLDVVDLAGGKARSAKVGHVQGIAMDDAGHYFAGDEQDQKLVVVNAKTLATEKEIKTPGPIDAIAYCPQNKLVYADHDDGTDVWVIDPAKGTIEQTIDVGGAPEFIEFDKATSKLYQNVKSTNSVAVIDPATNKVVSTFSTLPAEGPHGLAIDSKTERLFTAGRNGKLVVIDIHSGKQTGVVDIAAGVDQIAMDHSQKRIYCACKGAISVVEETADGAKFVENIPVHAGAHTLAVDEKTHAVWISYGNKTSGNLERIDLRQ